MSTLHLQHFANLAKEVDYQRRILAGALDQMSTAHIAPLASPPGGQEDDDPMGVPREHPFPRASLTALSAGSQQQVTLLFGGLGREGARDGSGSPLHRGQNNLEWGGHSRRPIPMLVETSSDEGGPPPLAPNTPSDEEISARGEEDSEPEAITQARANGQIRYQVEAARGGNHRFDYDPSADNGFRRCVICYDLSHDPPIWRQSKAHQVCVDCLRLYVEQQLDTIKDSSDKFRELVQNDGAIKCPAQECTGVFNPKDLFATLNKGQRGGLHLWMNKARTAKNH